MLVSCITPTMGRPERLPRAYETFASQAHEPKEWLVLDESAEPSAFFSGLRDERVRYFHEPKQGPREVTRIGAARNRLCERARGVVIEHLDDDDAYAPRYTSTMLGRLGSADIARLACFNCIQESSGVVFRWNTRQMGGSHWCVSAREVGRMDVDDVSQLLKDGAESGYGFGLVYHKDAWVRNRFPEEGVEDILFVRRAREAGMRIVQVEDEPGMVLHAIHSGSDSMYFPQERLGKLRAGMFGASPAGAAELPRGKDIRVVPGNTYEVLAEVKRRHTLRALVVRLEGYGIDVLSARDDVPGPHADGYRLVELRARSTRAGVLPWAVPKPLSFFDKSHVVRAWIVGQQPVAQVGARPRVDALGRLV